jgi:surface protein
VTLPLVSGYNYNFIVDWGDGSVGQVTTYNDVDATHTYALGGTYSIKMTGTLEGWSISGGALKNYIIEVSQWGRTGLKYISGGFWNCTRLTGVYGKLISTNITDFTRLFHGCTSLAIVECGDWDTSAVTKMNGTFYNCTSLTSIDVANWDVSNVTEFGYQGGYGNTYGTFENCTNITTLDLSSWNLQKAIYLRGTFAYCRKLTSIGCENWYVTKVVSFGSTFQNCSALTSLDLSAWVLNTTSSVVLDNTFKDCSGLTLLDVSTWNTSKVTTLAYTFSGCSNLTSLDVSTWNTISNTNCSGTFYNCSKLTTLDISDWSMGNVTTLSKMFYLCSKMTYYDVRSWSTPKVTDMTATWGSNTSLTSIVGLSSLTVNKVTSFGSDTGYGANYGTFYNTPLLTDLSGVEDWVLNTTSNITMVGMFWSCGITSLDLSGWNVSKCITFQNMFSNCSSITSINCANWTLNTSTNISMDSMFNNCTSLTSLDITGWNTSKVTSFNAFCNNCPLTSLDVSILNTSNCTNVSYIFQGTKIPVLDISSWDMSKITSTNYAFANNKELTSLTLPNSLTIITGYMCYGCSLLSTINVGTGVASIANGAFNLGGTAGRSITYNFHPSTAPTISGTPFANFNTADNVHLHVPTGSSSYNTAPWTTDAIFDQPISFDL